MTAELIIGAIATAQKIMQAVADYHATGAVTDEQLVLLRAANQAAVDDLTAKLQKIGKDQ